MAETQLEAQQHPEAQARFRIGVFAVIERGGTYLLAHRSDIDWWNLVGGGLEYGETVEEGLAREVREEVGVAIEIIRLIGIYSKPRKRELVLTFLCRMTPESPAPGTSEEVSEVAWFPPEHLPDNLLPKHRQRLEDALLGSMQALLRAQVTSTEEDQRIPKGM
ncbi:MAG TPA: NUDIX domain-containing protein [Ktedonobacterales bacterium]|nr:NUDIX domain-containing protein [Ktedonobacterales bacterium]